MPQSIAMPIAMPNMSSEGIDFSSGSLTLRCIANAPSIRKISR